MNRSRIITVLAIAIVLGVLTSSFVYRQMKRTVVVPTAPTGQIVVAAVRLPLGTPLDASQLRLIPWPAGSPVVGMFTRIEDCVNRVLTTSVIENEPILEGKLAPKDARGGLPAAIPEGMRALSVSVNDVVAVAGFALPGTVVDVLSTGSVEGASGGNSVTRTILENVRVLAAGQKIEQDKDGKPQTVPVITLLVTPEQATTLTMASTEGRIQLALRNTIDTKLTNPPPVYGATIFGGMPVGESHPKVAGVQPKAPSTFVIEVIRGDKRDTTTF
jgi:pilus assembly protein CpaB